MNWLIDIFGTSLSVIILGGILALAGLGALVFYGLYWTLRTWE